MFPKLRMTDVGFRILSRIGNRVLYTPKPQLLPVSGRLAMHDCSAKQSQPALCITHTASASHSHAGGQGRSCIQQHQVQNPDSEAKQERIMSMLLSSPESWGEN